MGFKERNEQWQGHTREFWQANSRSEEYRVWTISVQGPVISYTWGLRGGAIQGAFETCQGVNVGKKNEKSPERYALERAREMCRKKDREGYREVDDDGNFVDGAVITAIDFDNLPPSLCFYKPDNSMGPGITKKAEDGKVMYARKRNGLMFVIAKGSQPAKMYSRRMLRQHDDEIGTDLTWDHRFPHIIQSANAAMPANSILLGELVMDRDGADDFAAVQSYTKSLTAQSIQDQQRHGLPSFYVWDVAFWEGEDLVSKATLLERYDLVSDAVYLHDHLMSVDTLNFPTTSAAASYAKAKGWEGFVVVDPDGVYGDRAYNFKGKPDRPGQFCAKLKPSFEDDFLAFWDPPRGYGEQSTKGRYAGGIKCVALYQYNSKGELVYISNVSSGMTEEMKRDWANPGMYPMVWQCEFKDRRYVSQGDDTNALDFAAFVRVREDKKPEECVNPEL